MKKLYGLFAFLVMTGFSAATWANPCSNIAQSCKKAGFYKGGNKVGKGLIMDCVMPIVMGSKALPGTSFSTAEKSACKVVVMKKMKNQKIQ